VITEEVEMKYVTRRRLCDVSDTAAVFGSGPVVGDGPGY
jgi:hypothetical protein